MNIAQLRAAYAAAAERLKAARDAIEAADDTADFQALETELDEAAAEVERTKTNLQARERVEKLVDENPVVEQVTERSTQRVSVGREELTYRQDQHSFSDFVRDAYNGVVRHDPEARERIMRSNREQEHLLREKGIQLRDVGTGAFAGLTIPQYIVELWAPLARAGAPLLNAVRKLPLPASGMTVNVSRITTGSAVAEQASENSAVQETNIDDTLLTVDVRTYAGQQDVSRQAIERSEMVSEVVFQDLISDYFTKLDAAILNSDGTSGTHLGIRSTSGIIAVTYTDASPTVPELYPKVADAIQQINKQLYKPALAIVMAPRRWGWMTAAVDSSNRPFVVPNAAGTFNALGVGDAPAYGQVVGTMQGLPVITDGNILENLGAGTNQDTILVLRTNELLFWQEGDGMPRQLSFEQSNAPQSIRLAVWGYSAFTAGRYPKASAAIDGTGLVTPTF